MNLSPNQRRRRAAHTIAWLGTVVAALGLAVQVASALPAGTAPESVPELVPSSGERATPFKLEFPSFIACPGDANEDFRWATFITPISQDPATLTFDGSGIPLGDDVTLPLFESEFNEPVVVNLPSIGTGAIPITDFAFNFERGGLEGLLTPGDYWIGVVCTQPDNNFTVQNVRFWSTAITLSEGLAWEVSEVAATTTTTTTTTSTTTTTTTVAEATTTTTTVAGGTTTTTEGGGASGTTTTTVAGGSTNATVTPRSPSPGGSYSVGFPNCTVGETITFRQPESTPASVTDVCEASSALTSGSVVGLRMPAQATTGTATGSFTAAPTAPGSYTVTMTGTSSAQRTTTFVIVGPSTPVTGGNTNVNTGGSTSGNNSGTIPSTGSSTTALIVWGVLLVVFGRMAILLGREPKVISAGGR